MFRFENPIYLYFLAIVVLLIVWHYVANFARKRRIKRFGDEELMKDLMPDVSVWRPEAKFWLCVSALSLLLICLARPQYGTKIDTRKRSGIEAIIAVDVSNSMLAEDVSPNRLSKAKMLISNLVDHMSEDKIGLIVYAGEAFTQLPITSDYVSAKMFLDNISPSMVSVQGTDIARAITLATRSFTPQEGVGRAIFIITDGEDNEGGAIEAAKEAERKGMHVYILGIGSPEGSPIPMPGSSGYITDNAGNTVVSKLNEEMCREIAQVGGGAYIYVDNSSSAQSALQSHIDKLAKADMESTIYSEFDEHFMDFAWLALVLLVLEIVILARRSRHFRGFKLFKLKPKATSLVLLFILCVMLSPVYAQQDRAQIRKGNRLYRDSVYAKAQVEYQKAVEENPRNAVALYNLGNAQLHQGQPKEAMKNFEAAARIEQSKLRAAQIYHNMGVVLQSQKQFAEAIECYKNALRRNPHDEETRYNLALCQHQLQNQDQGQNEDQNNQDQNKEDQQQKQEQQKQQEQSQDQQKPEQQQPKMSQDNAEQMLKAALQDEKSTQDKVQKAQQKPQRRQLEKQW